jgi:hypothetical protein
MRVKSNKFTLNCWQSLSCSSNLSWRRPVSSVLKFRSSVIAALRSCTVCSFPNANRLALAELRHRLIWLRFLYLRVFEPPAAFHPKVVVNSILSGCRPHRLEYLSEVCRLILREDMPENVLAFSDCQPTSEEVWNF